METTPSELYPPPSGDFVVQTEDAVLFGVHRLFLKFASPILSDMLALGENCGDQTPGMRWTVTFCRIRELICGLVTITEDSETFLELLSFIYPDKTPTIFSDLDALLPVLDAAAKYEMTAVTNALARQLMSEQPDQGKHQKALVYTDPLRVYAKAKQFELVDLANAAANASLNINIYTTPRNIYEYSDMPASWLWKLLEMRQKRVKWWSHKLKDVPIGDMSSNYSYVGNYSHQLHFLRVSTCTCNPEPSSNFMVIPDTIKEKIRSHPCAKAVRRIDFAVELKCLRCGAAMNGSFKRLCEAYEAEFGTF